MVDVLVVDDSPFIQAMVAGLCEAEGWEVRTAGCVADARRVLAESRPRIVMLDYHLPDGYGPDLVAQARSKDPPPLLVALSMQPRNHVKDRFLKQDVHLVMDKEVILRSELIDVLRGHIRQRAEGQIPLRPDGAA